ncbi:MAG: flippase [Calothrix sp. MO_167.B42]|nr:flippase [Calothrix sp. MO_167.B42]
MLNKLKIQKLSLFQSGSKLRAIIANTGWLFADRLLRMGINLIVVIWVARYLGVQQYGLYNYAIAFITLFSPLATLGLDNIVIRDLVNDSSNKEKILGTAFCLKVLGGFASLLLAVSCIVFLHQDDILTIWIVSILGVAGVIEAVETIDFWFQSQVQSKYAVFARNIAFIVIALVKISLIQMQAPLIAFVWAALAEISLAGIGLAIAYRLKGFSIRLWRWSSSLAKTLLKESWPLILSGFTIMIYMKIDQIMLGKMLDDSAVGFYSAATRISEIWYFIPTAIVASVSPSIYEAKENDARLYNRRIKQLLRLMVLLSVAIAIPMTFLSGTIITLLFGNGYIAAKTVLSIHIWASLFVFMGVATSPWFIAENLTHLSLRRTLIGAVTNVILNILLIPTYGGIGAAIATVVAQAFASFFSNILHQETRKLFIIQIQSLAFIK